ncbi:hypothetical protein EKM02_14550, partial [Flavobacterium sp. RSP49]|uniref:thermonuclease family protein n=1 Tax=Flavobacterium sp. RSP49 TaxID=2497487 RepID=UPI000F99DC27
QKRFCKCLIKYFYLIICIGYSGRDIGYMSFEFLKSNVSIGDKCTLVQEKNNLQDKYGRSLGYLFLKDGRVLNEIMIKKGFAKPYNDVFCEMLPKYQKWNLQAKNKNKGLYSLVNKF